MSALQWLVAFWLGVVAIALTVLFFKWFYNGFRDNGYSWSEPKSFWEL